MASETDPKPPAVSDYNNDAVRRAVVRAATGSPAAVFPVVGGILAAAGGLLFQSTIALAAGGAGVVVGLGTLFYTMTAGKNSVRLAYIAELDRQRALYKDQLIGRVRVGLENSYRTKIAQDLAASGIKQFDSIRVSMESVKKVLGMKLQVDELTYGRYLGAAENAYLSVLDNLSDLVARLHSMDSIDPQAVQRRVVEDDNGSSAVLQERLTIHKEQEAKARAMLATNETVMTELERLSSKAADWKTDAQFSQTDVESAISDLVRLAEFAHQVT